MLSIHNLIIWSGLDFGDLIKLFHILNGIMAKSHFNYWIISGIFALMLLFKMILIQIINISQDSDEWESFLSILDFKGFIK